jgi:heptosyltransferase-2
MRSPSTTLVLIPNWLGDLVMALPALAALREDAQLVAVGAPGLLDLLVDASLVDAVVPYDRKGADAGLAGLWRVGRLARAWRPQRVVALPPSLRAAALAALTRARVRQGYGPATFTGLLNERHPTPPRSVHLADAWRALAGRTGEAGPAGPRLTPGPRGREAWAALRAELGVPGDYFVLSPGATFGPTKRWPEASYVQLGHAVATARGWTPLVVGGSDPTEVALCDRVAAACEGVSAAGRTSLPALAALLSQATAFVGNDSGPMHLAAAVGAATVGIFGSTSPTWTGPRGPRAATAGPHPVDCTPCFRRTCPIGLPCLNNLHVDNVLRVLGRVLSEP